MKTLLTTLTKRLNTGTYILPILALTVTCLTIASCASPSNNTETRYTLPNGHHITYYSYNEIRRTPEVIRPGNSFVSFHNNKPTVGTTASETSGGEIYTVKCRTWVETDNKGNIVKWQTQSNDCTP